MSSVRYHPPAVQYQLRPPQAPLRVVVCLWLLAAGLLVVWQWRTGPMPLAVRLGGGLCWVAAGLSIWQGARRAAKGLLAWDGGACWWQPAADGEWLLVQQLQLRMDLQSAMLLAWRSEGGWQYGWLMQASEPWRWGDWRRAVYSATTVVRTEHSRA